MAFEFRCDGCDTFVRADLLVDAPAIAWPLKSICQDCVSTLAAEEDARYRELGCDTCSDLGCRACLAV